MRIASTMMSSNYLKQLNKTYEQYSKLMEQSDGSKLHRASDDAVGYSKYLRYQNNKISNEQYQDNVSTASSWMKNADAALVNVTDLLQTFKAKVEQGANSTNNESDLKDIAKELLANVQEQVADLNTQIGDRFLFSGSKDTTMPFEISAEKQSRGDTLTLNESQEAYFSGTDWGDDNTTLKQMLKITCVTTADDGTTSTSNYYINVNNGDVYDEDFVTSGYKDATDKASNHRVGSVSQYRYDGTSVKLGNSTLENYFGCSSMKVYTNQADGKSYYADSDGNLYEADTVDAMITAASDLNKGSRVDTSTYSPTGNTVTLTAAQQKFFGTSTLTEYSDGTTTVYVDANNYTFDKDAVDTFVGLTADDVSTKRTGDTLSSVKNFRVSDYFNENGVINTKGIGLSITNYDGSDIVANSVFSLSTTNQYIVTYSGDDKYISMVKKNGGVDQATDTVNVTGQDLEGSDIFDVNGTSTSGTAMLNQLLYCVAKLEAGDYEWAGDEGMTIADKAHETVLGAETKMAARQQSYTSASSMLTTQNESITSDISDVSSTDVAYLATKLMEYQTIYSLSLSVGSKILPGTLADYLD